ncbi:uncharacterized protein LOC112560471 isoform X1 [Pomacea canaliculata]|uniref:uncharacterized protein LOC112560471 isoform X1 n=1 Tax=Pomacea canaliculata TaxID=400727 RepID=UPI000D72A9E0|nr:uncharacterized protein LOC112560471 isoform X1 [Pomacea canaliculata]XP_025088138.1 uncharacterized protein LOC112560471 isoform X1 [Pomacea canaliculata]
MFQPFPSIRRSPKQLTSPPQYEFASTRTTQLRAKEVKKRARQWKTFGLKPQKPKARSEEAEPVQNVAFNADSFKQKKDPSIKDNSSGKSKNRSASATGPYPPPAVTHTCDPLVIEHSNISSPKVPPGPGSPNVLDAKKTSPVLPSAARPRAQPDKSPQAVIGTVEVKGCVADRRSADKNSSFLARMCRDTSSSEGELDETIIASEDIPSRPASRECHSTSSEGTDSEERALPLPKAAEKGRKKVVVISDEDAFKASKPQGLSSSSAHYSTSWTTDEESAGPKTARKEKDGSRGV